MITMKIDYIHSPQKFPNKNIKYVLTKAVKIPVPGSCILFTFLFVVSGLIFTATATTHIAIN